MRKKLIKAINIIILAIICLPIYVFANADENSNPPTIVRTPIEYNENAASGGRIRFNEEYNGTYIRPGECKVEPRVGYIHVATEYNFVNGGFKMVAKYDPIPVLSYENVKEELKKNKEEANFEKIFNSDFGTLEYKAGSGGSLKQGDETKFLIVKNATNGLTVNYNLRFRDFDSANAELGGFTHPEPVAAEGYEFSHWELSGAVSSPDDVMQGDVVATAIFKKIHTVTFDSNGGTSVESQKVKDGEKANKPEDPTNGEKSFMGWFTDRGDKFDFNTVIRNDMTLKAKWDVTGEKNPVDPNNPVNPADPIPGGTTENTKVIIKFIANGGRWIDADTIKIIEAGIGENINILEAPTREGYVFDYWKGSIYHPGDLYNVQGSHTFVAQWKPIDPAYTGADNTADKTNKNIRPSTGDSEIIMSYALILALSICVMLVMGRTSRKEQ